ncbi:MAG: hypothetical protein HQM16_15240 [Deltaproteobacteria bacterium]|nr:hypothetical protein [Deltaproteobacteria bacterium]
MRLWSIHPKYLDAQGLVALWREGLLALEVLQGKTKGYRYHPQLERFKQCTHPIEAINHYLNAVLIESIIRGYKFDPRKIEQRTKSYPQIKVTRGQIIYEITHLKKKLWYRDRRKYALIQSLKIIAPHPLFVVVSGDVEKWEKPKLNIS